MKFLVSKDIHSNSNFTLLLGFYALMLLAYFIGDLFYLAHFFGTSVEEIKFTLLGNEEEFMEPMSLLSLLEHLHISAFLAIFALFTTMAIVLRLRLGFIHKKFIILLSMGTALLSFIALLGAYFITDSFAYGFFVMSITWHIIGIYALLITLKQVWFS